MITDVEGGDGFVQVADVFGMISGDVFEADVGERDCFLYDYVMFHVIIWYSHNNIHWCQFKLVSV